MVPGVPFNLVLIGRSVDAGTIGKKPVFTSPSPLADEGNLCQGRICQSHVCLN